MSNKIDPRVWQHNFAMEYDGGTPVEIPEIEPSQLDPILPEPSQYGQPRALQDAPIPTVQPPSYGPQVKEPQKTLEITPRRATGVNVTSETCPFGSAVQIGDDWFILGGSLTVGDKNYNVPNYAVTGTSTRRLYLQFLAEVHRDDAGEIFLPGTKTSSATSVSILDTVDVNYPDTTQPLIATGVGTLVIPLGQLVIEAGVPVFAGSRCGGIVVGHCNGSFTF